MNKLFIFLMILIIGCSKNTSTIDLIKPELQTMFFDVVQKELVIEKDLPVNVQNLLSQWFDENVKTNGIDGKIIFSVTQFNQEISTISDGKRVDIFLSFKALLNKPSLNQTKLIEGNVASYGTLTGNFSLEEFDKIIQNTQTDLIIRLSRDLQSKI